MIRIRVKNAGLGQTVGERLGFWFFLLLFPGFFFYHSAIAFGVFPAVLGGWFTPISIAAVAFVMPLICFNFIKNRRIKPMELLFFIFILYWSITFLFYYLFSDHVYSVRADVLDWTVKAIVANLACYAVARNINLLNKNLYKALVVSLIVIFLVVLKNANDGMFYLKLEFGDQESLATYQSFARSILVVGLFSLALSRKKVSIAPIFLITIVSLYLNGARSEFVFFIAAFFVYIWFVLFKGIAVKILWITIFFVCSVLVYVNFDDLISLLPHSRMLQLVDLASSSSAEGRADLLADAWKDILQSPILGSYAVYATRGGVGAYAHNMISAWVSLGLLGFIFYLFLLMSLVFSSYRLTRQNSLTIIVLMSAVILVVAAVFAKDFSYMLLGLAVGLYSNMSIQRKAQNI